MNRYYYQSRIPIKDAIILSRSDDPEFRRAWRKRVVDHDGNRAGEGGIERWLQLAEATGLDRERVIAGREILPGTRYAVDAYLNLVSRGTLLEAAASSLTELFSGRLIALRMDAMRKHYAWLEPGLSYFQARLTQAPEDAAFHARLGHASGFHARPTGVCHRARCAVSATSSGRSSTHCITLMCSRAGRRPERFSRGGAVTATNIPRLARGCRLSEDPGQGWVLLIPEGVLRLSGPGPRILQRCDGSRTFGDIVRELGRVCRPRTPRCVEAETSAFLERLIDAAHRRAWSDCAAASFDRRNHASLPAALRVLLESAGHAAARRRDGRRRLGRAFSARLPNSVCCTSI